ncbi:MAG: tetratricopeptide repeat protein [Rudaea sp.]
MTPKALNEAIHQGKLAEAAERLEHERDRAQARGDRKAAADVQNDLGVVYYVVGRLPDARATLMRARQTFAELEEPLGQARAMGNLARVEEKSDNTKAAEKLYWESAELFHQAGAAEEEFATMRQLSQLYLKAGGFLQAIATFDHALLVKPHRGLREAMLHRIYQVPLRMFGIGSA